MAASDFFNRQKEETLQRRNSPAFKAIYFDIETECHPDAESVFEPTFEPKEEEKPKIRTNLVDPIKILAAQEDLVARMAEWERKRAESVTEQREAWLNEGALRAERGRILAIGWKTAERGYEHVHSGECLIPDKGEEYVINTFIHALDWAVEVGATVAGHNIQEFDLPFIRRRCLIIGIPFPYFDRWEKWKPWKFPIYDSMQDWKCGNYRDKFISLDDLMRALGIGKKTESGADFAKLYHNPETRERALAYLRGDVEGAEGVCKRLLGI